MLYQGKARYPVTEVILHCADTRPEWMLGRPIAEKVAEIRRWHVQQRGWRDHKSWTDTGELGVSDC